MLVDSSERSSAGGPPWTTAPTHPLLSAYSQHPHSMSPCLPDLFSTWLFHSESEYPARRVGVFRAAPTGVGLEYRGVLDSSRAPSSRSLPACPAVEGPQEKTRNYGLGMIKKKNPRVKMRAANPGQKLGSDHRKVRILSPFLSHEGRTNWRELLLWS